MNLLDYLRDECGANKAYKVKRQDGSRFIRYFVNGVEHTMPLARQAEDLNLDEMGVYTARSGTVIAIEKIQEEVEEGVDL